MKKQLTRKDLVYPDLCYQIIGVLFQVWTDLGYGHKEKFYQKATAQAFDEVGLKFQKAKNLKLGIIAHFTRTGVKYKRIVNLEQ